MNPVVIALAVALVFGVLVTLHEFGHFTIAKLNGVKVLEFSIGFGTPLLKFRVGETEYAVRSVPLGGYVRLAGMDDQETGPRSFNSKPVWRRLSIIAAGSLTNLLLPIPIFFITGLADLGGPVTVVATQVGSPADGAEIPLNAEVVSLDHVAVHTAHQLRSIIRGSGGRPVAVAYRNPGNGGVFERVLTPVNQAGVYRVGISTVGGDFDLAGATGDALTQARDAVAGTFAGFVAIATGHIRGGIGGNCGPSGPVGIVRATAAAAQAGWVSLLQFLAFLSVNLGILNLLPLPFLDGGRLAFLVIEGVRRRPVDPAKEQRVHYAGLLMLLAFVLFVTYNDVLRLGISFDSLLSQCSG